jgi:hypothetical protein
MFLDMGDAILDIFFFLEVIVLLLFGFGVVKVEVKKERQECKNKGRNNHYLVFNRFGFHRSFLETD